MATKNGKRSAQDMPNLISGSIAVCRGEDHRLLPYCFHFLRYQLYHFMYFLLLWIKQKVSQESDKFIMGNGRTLHIPRTIAA